jgi:hypothetical protein
MNQKGHGRKQLCAITEELSWYLCRHRGTPLNTWIMTVLCPGQDLNKPSTIKWAVIDKLVNLCAAVHTAHCTLHTAHCTLHTAHCTLHTAPCTLHTAHCTLHTAHDRSVVRDILGLWANMTCVIRWSGKKGLAAIWPFGTRINQCDVQQTVCQRCRLIKAISGVWPQPSFTVLDIKLSNGYTSC